MTHINRLKQEAAESCRFRGHNMGRFQTDKYGASATCNVCGAEVQVTPRPMPNEIEIGGEAVALNCKD